MQVTVNVTSIEESDAASIQVYPNPTSGITTLTIQGLNSTQAEIQLMDLTGRILTTKQVELLSEGVETTLNMSKFAAGVYVVRIQSGDFKAVRRIVRK
jgi:hypothetical protein